MDSIQLKLCDIQGRLFERSTAYASEGFIRDFMNSEVAEHLDSPYNKLQWMGEEYLIEELKDEKELVLEEVFAGCSLLDWVCVPLLGLFTWRKKQENIPTGTG